MTFSFRKNGPFLKTAFWIFRKNRFLAIFYKKKYQKSSFPRFFNCTPVQISFCTKNRLIWEIKNQSWVVGDSYIPPEQVFKFNFFKESDICEYNYISNITTYGYNCNHYGVLKNPSHMSLRLEFSLKNKYIVYFAAYIVNFSLKTFSYFEINE